MTQPSILLEIDQGVALLTLNRPDNLNSFNVEMHERMREAISTVRKDESVRVLVITGSGRGFCLCEKAIRKEPERQRPVRLFRTVEGQGWRETSAQGCACSVFWEDVPTTRQLPSPRRLGPRLKTSRNQQAHHAES